MIDRETAIAAKNELGNMWHQLEPDKLRFWIDKSIDMMITALSPQWQDIATAPKDGSSILVWCVHGQYVATWEDDLWMVDDNKSDYIPLRGEYPSHWMPLPEAPTQ